MKASPDRFFGAFAVLFTAIFPLLAGYTAAKCHTVFADAIGRGYAGRSAFEALPAIPGFIFSNLHGLLWALFVLVLGLVLLGFLQFRVEDVATRLTRQFVIAFASAFTSLAFLVFYCIALAQALMPGAL
jgi:hypothetical protein